MSAVELDCHGDKQKEKQVTMGTRGKMTRSVAIEDESDPPAALLSVNKHADLVEFIRSTMGKSVKDRNIILRIETDLVQFIKDSGRTSLPFPSMSSYHRMLVHKIATIFELDHNIDPIGNYVVASKNDERCGKVLDFRFKDLLENSSEAEGEEDRKVVVIQRAGENHNHQPFKKDDTNTASQKTKKTLEERAEDYQRARRRIFLEESDSWTNQGKSLTKVESFDETSKRNNRNKMFGLKSYSFGGYNNTHHHGNNFLGFKQDSTSSASSGLSPASSGYKSQASSFQAPTPPPPPSNQGYSGGWYQQGGGVGSSQVVIQQQQHQPVAMGQKVLWAVTDLAHVPPGAIVIDPQTGQTLQRVMVQQPLVVENLPPQHQPPPQQQEYQMINQFQAMQISPLVLQQQQQQRFFYVDQQQYYNKPHPQQFIPAPQQQQPHPQLAQQPPPLYYNQQQQLILLNNYNQLPSQPPPQPQNSNYGYQGGRGYNRPHNNSSIRYGY